jgi:hypothetical protein
MDYRESWVGKKKLLKWRGGKSRDSLGHQWQGIECPHREGAE